MTDTSSDNPIRKKVQDISASESTEVQGPEGPVSDEELFDGMSENMRRYLASRKAPLLEELQGELTEDQVVEAQAEDACLQGGARALLGVFTRMPISRDSRTYLFSPRSSWARGGSVLYKHALSGA